MIDENELRKSLLAKREQLLHRIGGTQATERREVAEGQNALESRSPRTRFHASYLPVRLMR